MKWTYKHVDKHTPTVDPKAWVLHTDLGTAFSTTQTITGSKSVSYNWYIKKNGDVIEFVPEQYGAWHAGYISDPTVRAVTLFNLKQTKKPTDPDGWEPNVNGYSWSICYEGKGERATKAQVESAVEIIRSKETKELPLIAHQELTSYKPKVVKDFHQRIGAMLRGCTLDKWTTSELIQEIIKRIRKS